MKRLAILSIFLMIISVLAIGCSKEAPMHPAEVEKQAEDAEKAMPDIGDATPEPEAEPKKPATETPETTAEQKEEPKLSPEEKVSEITSETELPEQELAPLGTRYYGDEAESIDEVIPEFEDQVVVNLIGLDKTMDQGDLTIKVGTTVTYKNTDSWPHTLAVETGHRYEAVRYAEERLEAGEVWSYKFTEPETFLVRDLFSGTMRHYVTVK